MKLGYWHAFLGFVRSFKSNTHATVSDGEGMSGNGREKAYHHHTREEESSDPEQPARTDRYSVRRSEDHELKSLLHNKWFHRIVLTSCVLVSSLVTGLISYAQGVGREVDGLRVENLRLLRQKIDDDRRQELDELKKTDERMWRMIAEMGAKNDTMRNEIMSELKKVLAEVKKGKETS